MYAKFSVIKKPITLNPKYSVWLVKYSFVDVVKKLDVKICFRFFFPNELFHLSGKTQYNLELFLLNMIFMFCFHYIEKNDRIAHCETLFMLTC